MILPLKSTKFKKDHEKQEAPLWRGMFCLWFGYWYYLKGE